MPWNTLVLPLLAGYFLLSYFEYTKFSTERLDRQRLIFRSSIFGFGIIFLTVILRMIVDFKFPFAIPYLYQFLPFKTPYIGTSLFSLVATVIGVFLVNLFVNKGRQADRVLKKHGNTFEQMMRASFVHAKLIQFTLDTNKSYIAYVKETFKPGSNYIRVIPILSGYRRSETLELVLTTDYFEVFEKFISNNESDKIDEVDLIITLDNVVSVSYFDSSFYNEFNPNNKLNSPTI